MTIFLAPKKAQKLQIKQQYKQRKEALKKELKQAQLKNFNLNMQVTHHQGQAGQELTKKKPTTQAPTQD